MAVSNKETSQMGASPVTFFEQLLEEIDATEKAVDCVFSLGKKGSPITVELLERKGGTKQDLAKVLIKLVKQLRNNSAIMKKAGSDIENSREEEKKRTVEVMKLQSDLLSCKSDQMDTYHQAIGDQLKSYSDVVKSNAEQSASIEKLKETIENQALTPISNSFVINELKTEVKKAVIETKRDMDRSKNLIFFGLDEPENESEDHLKGEVVELLEQLVGCDTDAPPKHRRLGTKIPGRMRPILVTFETTAEVHDVLKHKKYLKRSDEYHGVYINPDETREEKKRHKDLVEKLREKINESPHVRHYIKDGRIHSDEKAKKVSLNRDKNIFYKFDTVDDRPVVQSMLENYP